jgi:hypothetical protein
MELNGWSSPQMLARYGASARSARARRSYDRVMTTTHDITSQQEPVAITGKPYPLPQTPPRTHYSARMSFWVSGWCW